MLKKSFIIIVLWLACCANLSAQLQNNIWSFGYDHGAFLDFTNPSAPVLSPSNMYAVEGCASVCDPNTGQLMFYTNGNIVHDRNMNPMPNGSGLLGNGYGSEFDHGSGAQGVMIVPFQPGKYYIFEIDPNVVNPGYLQYSMVDMALNGGLGDVVAGKKNIIVGEGYCEGMATVVGDNCNIWLLVQKRGPNWMGRELAAFSIGVTGLNPTPVISNCGSIAHWTLNPSVDGTMVSGASAVYRFNKTTGQFSPLIPVITEEFVYGSAFSQDGSKLYVTNMSPTVLQYNLALMPNVAAVLASETALPTGKAGGIRMGPEGKLYVSTFEEPGILRIDNPNAAGAACNLVHNAIPVPTGYRQGFCLGIPVSAVPFTLSESLRHPDLANCDADSILLTGPDGYALQSWSNGAQGVSTYASQAGWYTVTSSNGCDARIDSFRVTGLRVRVDLGNDTTVCSGKQTTITASTNAGEDAVYAWQDGSAAERLLVNTAGTYKLTVSEAGCSGTDEVRVNVEPCECTVMMPNAFSPNNDGRNDKFGLERFCRIDYYQLQIFNRWGQRVFLSASPDIKWDGSFQGTPCEAGTYFFDLAYNQSGKEATETLKGDLQLLR